MLWMLCIILDRSEPNYCTFSTYFCAKTTLFKGIWQKTIHSMSCFLAWKRAESVHNVTVNRYMCNRVRPDTLPKPQHTTPSVMNRRTPIRAVPQKPQNSRTRRREFSRTAESAERQYGTNCITKILYIMNMQSMHDDYA